MATKKKRMRKKRKPAAPYTKAELNRLIDSLCHPLFDIDKGFIVLDGFLHALVEQNPPLTIRKFIRHNLPRLIKNMIEHRNGQLDFEKRKSRKEQQITRRTTKTS